MFTKIHATLLMSVTALYAIIKITAGVYLLFALSCLVKHCNSQCISCICDKDILSLWRRLNTNSSLNWNCVWICHAHSFNNSGSDGQTARTLLTVLELSELSIEHKLSPSIPVPDVVFERAYIAVSEKTEYMMKS